EDAKKIYNALLEQSRKKTAEADQLLDDEGKVIKDDPADLDGVIIVESGTSAHQADSPGGAALRAAQSTPEPPTPKPQPKAPKPKVQSEQKLGSESRPTRKPEPKKPKPKMRLVNGKLVPIDDGPGLF
ncbi:MAG: hypothetical protein ACK51T_15280, partial [bacterium]